jgi:hypothetical protein
VAYFKTDQEVYEHVGGLFADLRGDDELASRFKSANTVVQFRYRHPAATITVRLMPGQEAQLDLGPTRLVPEVIMTMDADVAHRFWLGRVNVTSALARGQIKATGPVAKVLRLVPLVRPVFARYRARLEQAGREDLARLA